MDKYAKLQDDLAKAKFQLAKVINRFPEDKVFTRDDLVSIVKEFTDWHPVHNPSQWVSSVLNTWQRKQFLEHVNPDNKWLGFRTSLLKQYRRKARIVLKVKI